MHRYRRLRAALGAVLALTLPLTGCATAIDGEAAVAPGVTTTASPADPTDEQADEPADESSLSAAPTPDESDPPTDELPDPVDEPTDDPFDPGDLSIFSGELPEGWPAELTLPDGASIFTATADGGTLFVLFTISKPASDVLAHFDERTAAMGRSSMSQEDFGGTVVVEYWLGGRTVNLALIEYEGETTGTIEIS